MLTIATLSLVLCFSLFLIGRRIGRHLGDEIDGGQALFQKNTASPSGWPTPISIPWPLSVRVSYVLWQNIVNSVELWEYRRKTGAKNPIMIKPFATCCVR